jgi:glycosyltransferase involved in cell wall biosynthesis
MRAINSVIGQSYENIEIIVIDDGSSDNTNIVVNEISRKVNNLQYFTKENGGCASARNKGLELATGDYISFLDSDDQWETGAIEGMVNKLEESSADLVYSPSIEVYKDGREEINLPIAAGEPENLAVAHFMHTNVRNGSYMFTRSAFKEVGCLNETLRYNEDSDFFQRMSIHCKAVYFPEPTVKVLNHENSKSRNRIGIYKALLISSENTLVDYPDFALRVGLSAEKRIRQIKCQLVEALILANEWIEAQSIANEVQSGLSLNVRFALQTKWNDLIKLELILRRYLGKIWTLVRHLFARF